MDWKIADASRRPRRARSGLGPWTAAALCALNGTLVSSASEDGETCTPDWVPAFGPPAGLSNDVRAIHAFDAGGGPTLFVATGGVLRWTGRAWEAQPGIGANAFAEHDDGSGLALYAGGSGVKRLDGANWLDVGTDAPAEVFALTVFDDGSGPALYAGGREGSGPFDGLARWDGSSWSSLGELVGNLPFELQDVFALLAFDDGSGPALYAGGNFDSIDGVPANGLAKWDGSTWTAIPGLNPGDLVHAFAEYDDGTGSHLFVGGDFDTAGGNTAHNIARWDGASWAALGDGSFIGIVRTLAVFDDGGGAELHAGTSSQFSRWNGSSWSVAGSGVGGGVKALFVEGDGPGSKLHVGGSFESIDGVYANRIATTDGTSWEIYGGGFDFKVESLTTFDDGGGEALYVGGGFDTVGGVLANGVAKWDGAEWSSLGGGVQATSFPSVFAMVGHDDGSGPALYVGGNFYINPFPDPLIDGLARWDGSSWSSLGMAPDTVVNALLVRDDGSGPALYAGGRMAVSTPNLAYEVARWDGATWSPVGGVFDERVISLAEFDDGSGPALYAGGVFSTAGGVPVTYVARWDGAAWSPVGGPLVDTSGDPIPGVQAMLMHDDGSGPALYVAGRFTSAGSVPANQIARWDGTSWSTLGTGLELPGSRPVAETLVVFDAGTGPQLYVGGFFSFAGGVLARGTARWDGSQWFSLGPDGGRNVDAIVAHDDGSGPALYVGGQFQTTPLQDAFLSKWAGCVDASAPKIVHPTKVVAYERPGSPSGEFVHFEASAVDDVDPSPEVVCVPASGSFFPYGTTVVTCTATDASGRSSQAQFPVEVRAKITLVR